jgi:hypothetical protein
MMVSVCTPSGTDNPKFGHVKTMPIGCENIYDNFVVNMNIQLSLA